MITHMASSGDYCIFVFHSDKPIDDPLNLPPNYIPSSPLQYHLSGSTYTPPSLQTVHEIQVHDSIGAPLVRKTLPLHPNYVSMSNRYAAFASNTHILLWSYSNEFQKEQYTHKQGLVSATKAWRRQLESETIIEIVKPDPNAVVFMEELEGVKIVPPVTSGFITCVAVTDSVLLVGRENSTITRYSVPDMKEIDVFNVPTTPISISINCDNTRYVLRYLLTFPSVPFLTFPPSSCLQIFFYRQEQCTSLTHIVLVGPQCIWTRHIQYSIGYDRHHSKQE